MQGARIGEPETVAVLEIERLATLRHDRPSKLREHGFAVSAEPESFLVTKQDWLEPQEQNRARDWGTKLAMASHPAPNSMAARPVALGD